MEHKFTIPPLKVLAAVSGGMDSMCLASLLLRSGTDFGIAHCNFRLRGEESDADEKLVRKWAETHEVPFYTKAFDTESYAAEKGISIEMAARELRYSFFAETAKKEGYQAVAVAHNANDNAETLILNMLRGSGSRGMSGMRERSSIPVPGYEDIPLLRPLLRFSREEIAEFIEKEAVPYREDRTNSETLFKRNKIRNLIFPLFKEINPSFLKALNADAVHIAEVSSIADDFYAARVGEVLENEKIDLKKLKALPHWKYILFRIMEEHGFLPSRIEVLMAAVSSDKPLSGKIFLSDQFKATTTSSSIIISPSAPGDHNPIEIDSPGTYFFNRREVRVEVFEKPSSMELKQPKGVIVMDESKCPLPFILRGWNEGDRFVPFGMKGSKKLQDWFSDRHWSIPEKDSAILAVRKDGRIAAILGETIDNTVRVTPRTKNIIRITFI